MNWFRNKAMERRLRELEEDLRALRGEVETLRHASTMRVGDPTYFWDRHFGYYADSRPVLTAMQILEKLMADAGIEPKEVSASPARVEFVQRKESA